MSRAQLIVRERERAVLIWHDYRGIARRVPRWQPWRRVKAFPFDADGAADAAILIHSRRNGLSELAAFLRGKRLTPAELRHLVTGEVG